MEFARSVGCVGRDVLQGEVAETLVAIRVEDLEILGEVGVGGGVEQMDGE